MKRRDYFTRYPHAICKNACASVYVTAEAQRQKSRPKAASAID
ncbi:hypothetical protein vfu_A01147 [Vibrio furnissii NCTC 11218]|nr:hypothetical protein vfu_A01147 [Vibrio furnissii NCTC 11218]